ncbi:MAG: ATPase, T2SS/T4P/T4SS family [Candidatus Omnitrophota bacterium]
MKIGEILVGRGYFTQADLDKGLHLQEERPQMHIGEILREMGVVEEEALLAGLSEQLSIPFQKDLALYFTQEIGALIPFELWHGWTAIPIKKEGKIFIVSTDPLALPRMEIEKKMQFPVDLAFGLSEEIINVLTQGYWRPAQEKREYEEPSVLSEMPVIETEATGENLLDLANKAPVIRLLNQIIFQALQQGASDIHLQPQKNEFRVRYRIDGILHDVFTLSSTIHPALISRVKILSKLNIAERRLPQDGRTTVSSKDHPIDIRVSILPTTCGEAAVLRLLDPSSFLFSLATLGLYPDELEQLEQLISSDHGIILLTGPTGSGKTTTLYASLQKINQPSRNMITLEDPIEYQLPGLSQIQVNPAIGLSFAAGLRSILRHDPDILMIGEIRDKETADMAIQASLTGHLVFSTLHTNDAASALTRLLEMGIEPYLISSALLAVIAQRLVRLLCPRCKENTSTESQRSRGCEYCFHTGYRGRTGIFEFLAIDDEIRQMIMQKKPSQEIKDYALKKGMRTLRTSGEIKNKEGLTTLEEVLRVTT